MLHQAQFAILHHRILSTQLGSKLVGRQQTKFEKERREREATGLFFSLMLSLLLTSLLPYLLPYFLTFSLTHSLTHSLTCSPAHLLTCSPAHLLTCSPAHLLTYFTHVKHDATRSTAQCARKQLTCAQLCRLVQEVAGQGRCVRASSVVRNLDFSCSFLRFSQEAMYVDADDSDLV